MVAANSSVTFTLTRDEYVAGGKLSFLALLRRPSLLLVLFAGVVVTMLIVGSIGNSPKDSNAVWLQYGLVFAAIVGMLALSYFVSVPASYRRNYKHHRHLHEPITWSWDSSGFEVRTENSNSHLRWADVFRASENRQFVLIYLTPQLMHILPKRTLTAAQIDELRSCFAEK
jgi:hypothetical protein